MGTHLTFQYDREADILYINTCAPYPEQGAKNLRMKSSHDLILKPTKSKILRLCFFLHDYCVGNFFNYQFPLICGGNQ